MIQAAHAGIGIDANEGKQASLAADFSITQFSHVCRLLLVHGRFCYKRSCALSQFVMHRFVTPISIIHNSYILAVLSSPQCKLSSPASFTLLLYPFIKVSWWWPTPHATPCFPSFRLLLIVTLLLPTPWPIPNCIKNLERAGHFRTRPSASGF